MCNVSWSKEIGCKAIACRNRTPSFQTCHAQHRTHVLEAIEERKHHCQAAAAPVCRPIIRAAQWNLDEIHSRTNMDPSRPNMDQVHAEFDQVWTNCLPDLGQCRPKSRTVGRSRAECGRIRAGPGRNRQDLPDIWPASCPRGWCNKDRSKPNVAPCEFPLQEVGGGGAVIFRLSLASGLRWKCPGIDLRRCCHGMTSLRS